QAAHLIHGLRRADEHLLRVTAAERACTTKWMRVDHRHGPSSPTALASDDASGSACANHDEIELESLPRVAGHEIDRSGGVEGGLRNHGAAIARTIPKPATQRSANSRLRASADNAVEMANAIPLSARATGPWRATCAQPCRNAP